MTDWIVVEDPLGEWWEGALVDEGRKRQLESRGVVLLPCLPDLFRRSGVGGFHKRAWGAGLSVNGSQPRTVAPLTVYCSPEFHGMYWAARLIPEPPMVDRIMNDERNVFQGFLRFIADASQANPNKLGVTPRNVFDLGTLDKRHYVQGGFIIRGDATLTVPGEAHYGFALYGTAPGLRIVWMAASQATA